MLRAPVVLSHAAYEMLWECSELPPMPPAISISYPLRSADDGARIARQAFGELHRGGLADGDDVHPDLLATLRALGKGARRYYAMLGAADGTTGGHLVAVEKAGAVLATLVPGGLRLDPVPPGEPARVLVSRLPPAPAAQGRALRVREDRPGDGAASLRELVNAERTFVAHLYAEKRDLSGNVERCPDPLVAFDVAGGSQRGRWYTRRRPWGGAAWVLACPASAETLVATLTDMDAAL
jgi:hypothetical protein